VNPQVGADLQVECALSRGTASEGKAQILHDADFNAYNSFDNPDRIVPKPHPVAVEGAKIRIDLPSMSVATVVLRLA
jgi:alpha-N-arabinofuranosidase